MNTENAAIGDTSSNYNSDGSSSSSSGIHTGDTNSDSSSSNDDDVQQSTYNTIVEFGLKDNVSLAMCIVSMTVQFKCWSSFFVCVLCFRHIFLCVWGERAYLCMCEM